MAALYPFADQGGGYSMLHIQYNRRVLDIKKKKLCLQSFLFTRWRQQLAPLSDSKVECRHLSLGCAAL